MEPPSFVGWRREEKCRILACGQQTLTKNCYRHFAISKANIRTKPRLEENEAESVTELDSLGPNTDTLPF
jgi:hypothetical protein